jgi:tetratricopeptide (TPR) repeat protein
MTDTHIHDAAYRALDSDTARRMYRLLSVHDGPDITAEPAAAITGTTVAEVTALLAALAQAHLLTDLEGRYRFHDVTGAHARTLAEQIENERDLKDAFLRGMFWWRAKAASAAMLLNPERWYHWDGFTRTPRLFPDRDTALEWLETERFNLLATVRAAHRHRLYAVVCQFAEAMWMLFSLGHHYSIWEATYQLALNAAEAAGDLEQQARAWEGLAAFYLTQKRFTEARDVATHALELERLTGHTKGEGTALEQRSTALRCLGELDAAAADLHASMQLYHDQGHQRGVEIMRRHLGELALTAGDYPTAIDHLNTAEQWFATADPEEPYLQSRAAYALGQACHLSGDHDQAYAALERALTFARRARADQQEAHVLVALAELIGDDAAEPARQHLRRAYELYKTKGAPEAEVIGERIGR